MLAKALVTSPDFGKTTPVQMAALVQYLDGLDPAMAERLLTLPDGIQTKTKFIPSIADLAALKAELEARDNQFRPAPTHYRKFTPQDEPEIEVPPLDRRKQVVAEVLGYDPQDARSRRKAEPPAFATVKIEDLKSSDDLKTPPRPISPEMRKFLEEQGWPHLPAADDAR